MIFNKFLVIKFEDIKSYLNAEEVSLLNSIIDKIDNSRKICGKKKNKYFVINQDELYAKEIMDMISKNKFCKICKIKLDLLNVARKEDDELRYDSSGELWCKRCTEEHDNIDWEEIYNKRRN